MTLMGLPMMNKAQLFLMNILALAGAMFIVSLVHCDTPLASAIMVRSSERTVDPCTLARAIEAVESSPDRQAMLLTLAIHESDLSQRIAFSLCGPDWGGKIGECDHGLAWGIWQQHSNALNARDWGSKSLAVQARWAARTLRGAWARCAGYPGVPDPLGAIRAYAGRGCDQAIRGEDRRMRTYMRIRAQL